MNKSHTNGFTLIEVALSIAILAAGSTACIAMFVTGMHWMTIAKCNSTAPSTAQAVAETPQVFNADPRNTGGPYTYTIDGEGWVNNYYAVRTVSNVTPLNDASASPTGGYIVTVDVDIYHGGDKDTGDIVYNIKRILHFRVP